MTVVNTGPYLFTDHEIAALARVLEQDKNRTVLKKLISIHAQRIQRLEDLLWQLHESFSLDTAVGDQLDMLGAIVGEPRQGRTDDIYRLWVRARGRANRSAGTPNDSLAILRLVVEADTVIGYVDQDPRDAEYRLNVSGSDLDLNQVKQILDSARPAGVQLDLIADAGAGSFAFLEAVGLGFDDGVFASVI